MSTDSGRVEARGRTGKSPDAFRTISEVADDLDVPQHVLRFWETKFNQIKPLKRGGGRRYYRPDDVLLLRGIRHLLYEDGYTIKGVQKILKDKGLRAVIHEVREVWTDVAGLAAMVHETSAAELDDEPGDDVRSRIRGIIAELDDIKQLLKS